MENKDFFKDMGYELPPETSDVKSDSFEYYRHPAGVYQGVFGKLTAKYKDGEGKKCDSTALGASLSHFTAALWIIKYLGILNKPENKPVLMYKEDKFIIPPDTQPAELYFPLMISYNPKDQWKVQKLFEKFTIPGHEHLRLVKLNPVKPTEKSTNFPAFPAYYGVPIKFTIDLGQQKGSPYCSSIQMLDTPRYNPEAIATLEKEIEQIIEMEKAKRQNQQQEYSAPPPPEADLNDLLEDDIFSKG